VRTPETCAKLSAIAQNRPPMPDEQRAAVSEQFKGKPQSSEHIAKRVEGARRFHRRRKAAGIPYRRADRGDNHVVVSVEVLTETRHVYDMTVPGVSCFVANGVVVHNSCGFPHEHTRQQIVTDIDPAKAIEYFGRTQGWSAQQTRQQVLTPLDEASLMATPQADEQSVMCYWLPGA